MSDISINRSRWAQGEKRHCPLDTHKRIRDNVIAGNLTFVNICREDCFYREQCRKKKKKNLIPSTLPKLNHGIRGKNAIALYTRRRKSRNARQKRLDHYTHDYQLCSIFLWPSLLCCKIKSLRERKGIFTQGNQDKYHSPHRVQLLSTAHEETIHMITSLAIYTYPEMGNISINRSPWAQGEIPHSPIGHTIQQPRNTQRKRKRKNLYPPP